MCLDFLNNITKMYTEKYNQEITLKMNAINCDNTILILKKVC